MTHLSPDEMVLHYYSEAAPEVESHLAGCEHCRAEYRELQRVLNAVDGFGPPERDAAFEARLWSNLKRELPARAFGRRFWLGWKPAAALGTMTLMAAAFLVGRWSADPTPSIVRADPVLIEAVGHHIHRSEGLLQEVANRPGVRLPREEVADLLGANRLYRQSAAMSGEAAVADVLAELEQLLMELENQDEDSEGRLRVLRDSLLFKLRVAAEELQRREARESQEDDAL